MKKEFREGLDELVGVYDGCSIEQGGDGEVIYLDEARYEDYVIEFFKDEQDEKYYWQAAYDGDDRRFSNFNIWITARGISLYSEDENAYPTKADAVSEAKKWVDEQKRKWKY